jgi:hypothetical protein
VPPLILIALLSAAASAPPSAVDWRTLRGLNYRTGEQSDEIRKLNGATVIVKGYMVPFDDDDEQTLEFLIVPVMGQCVHLPPPPPNQIVLVRMADKRPTKVHFQDLVLVEGRLEVADQKSPFGKVSYALAAMKVEKR